MKDNIGGIQLFESQFAEQLSPEEEMFANRMNLTNVLAIEWKSDVPVSEQFM